MDSADSRSSPLAKLQGKKVYRIAMDGSEPDLELPRVHLTPSSFVEFASSTDGPVFVWDGGFGVINNRMLYWTSVRGIDSVSALAEFYKYAGPHMDELPGDRFTVIKSLLTALGLKSLDSLLNNKELVDYALSLGLLRINIDGRDIEDWESLSSELFGYGSIEEVNVSAELPVESIRKCMAGEIKTYDQCVLKMKYGMSLEDYRIISLIDDLFRELGDWEPSETPVIEDGRVIIGKRRYGEPVYLADIFPAMDHFRNTITDFKVLYTKGKVKNYPEYMLLKKKQYTVEDLRSMIEEGLIRVKIDGEYRKVMAVEPEERDIKVIDAQGDEYRISELLAPGSPQLAVPIPMNYHSYKKSRYKYYVEWKILKNVRNDDNRAPRNIDEFKKLVSLGLVRVHGKPVKELVIRGREVFLIMEDGTELELYPLVSSRNEFEIEGMIGNSLKWIRRYLNEGFDDRYAMRLVLAIKELELAKKESVPVSALAKSTGIPEKRLEIYLTSDRFKRFGELERGVFRLHPDIEEFKNSVKVRRNEEYEYILVDGRNVMHGGEEKDKKIGKVGNIITVIDSLKKRGIPEDRIIVIVKNADFNKHRVDDLDKLRELESKGIIKAISYGYDDIEILKMALEELNALIITNDRYTEFEGGNITREDLDNRLIGYTFRGKQFHIKKTSLPKLEKLIDRFKNKE